MFLKRKGIILLTFSGLDGAGKSTQINKLRNCLSTQGYSSSVLWARGGYTPGFEYLKRLARLILKKKLPKPGRSAQRKQQFSRPGIAKIWLSFAMVDLMIYWGFYLRLKQLTGDVVICDRYLQDTNLDFSRNFPKVAFEKMLLWKLLCLLVPTPDCSFLLWVPVAESVRRGKIKDEPFPDDLETLEWRLLSYLDDNQFPKSQYLKIDCSKTIDDVSTKILTGVQQLINK